MDIKPIGVFDSGVGGLTVLKRLREVLPNEDYIYFGDTKRVPYGDKSQSLIREYANQIINFMKDKNTKIVVVACNTTCASINKEDYDVVLFDVLEAGAKSASNSTKNKKVGVIATKRTIESNSYEENIKAIDKEIKIISKACPKFVPIVESGLANSDEADNIAKEYLNELSKSDIDTLILGCTHYPILINSIKKILRPGIMILDPAIMLSREVKEYLKKNNMLNKVHKGHVDYYVSGDKDSFKKTAKMVINEMIDIVNCVDIEKYS